MIIYFEGLSGVGKSSLIDQYPQAANIIKIPQFLEEPDNIFNDGACMLNDERKAALAKANRCKTVLVDRGYLSTLVYGIARAHATGGKESYAAILEWVLENMDGKLVRPDIYVFVDTDNQTCFDRALADNRVLPESYWYKDLDDLRFWYKKLFTTLEKDIPVYHINGNAPMSENINILTRIIDENSVN